MVLYHKGGFCNDNEQLLDILKIQFERKCFEDICFLWFISGESLCDFIKDGNTNKIDLFFWMLSWKIIMEYK